MTTPEPSTGRCRHGHEWATVVRYPNTDTPAIFDVCPECGERDATESQVSYEWTATDWATWCLEFFAALTRVIHVTGDADDVDEAQELLLEANAALVHQFGEPQLHWCDIETLKWMIRDLHCHAIYTSDTPNWTMFYYTLIERIPQLFKTDHGVRERAAEKLCNLLTHAAKWAFFSSGDPSEADLHMTCSALRSLTSREE